MRLVWVWKDIVSNGCGVDETMKSNRRNNVRIAIWCAAVVGLVCLTPAIAAANIPLAERQALLELYRSTHGDDWTDHTDWGGEPGSECEWFGIVCGNPEDHIQGIILDRNGLSGPLPARFNQLKGLIKFSAKGNELTGSIPSLSGMQSLEYFEVSENQLSGALPELAGLARLTSFHAARNQLSGPLPRMTGLAALEFFEAGDNKLSGPIFSFDGLSHLKMLDLRSNQLSGPIPDMKGATGLLELTLSDNQLSGSLPAPPPSLMRASLCHNQLVHPSTDASLDAAWTRRSGGQSWWLNCYPR